MTSVLNNVKTITRLVETCRETSQTKEKARWCRLVSGTETYYPGKMEGLVGHHKRELKAEMFSVISKDR